MHANIGSCAIFAASSGSSVATAATVGTVAYSEIERHHYNEPLFLGSLAAGRHPRNPDPAVDQPHHLRPHHGQLGAGALSRRHHPRGDPVVALHGRDHRGLPDASRLGGYQGGDLVGGAPAQPAGSASPHHALHGGGRIDLRRGRDAHRGGLRRGVLRARALGLDADPQPGHAQGGVRGHDANDRDDHAHRARRDIPQLRARLHGGDSGPRSHTWASLA